MNCRKMTDAEVLKSLLETKSELSILQAKIKQLQDELLYRNRNNLDDGLWTPYGQVTRH